MTDKNPLLDTYNYWYPYQRNVEKLKESSPEILEFAKLCFETFESAAGKKLMQLIVERYLLSPMVVVGSPQYDLLCVYAAGFREALLMLKNGSEQHLKYINDNKAKV